MGYYADLIKQKQEKRNFRADPLGFGPTVVGVGTPDDYKAKFKVGDKVKFYSGEGVIVKGPIKMRFSLTPTYHIKVTTGKEAGREVSRYEEELKKNSKDNAKEDVEKIKSQIVSVKAYLKDRLEKQKSIAKEVEGTQRELERLEKLLGQNNSKEEKDNASVQDRFRHKGCMITILKKGENQYTFSVEQDGREEGSNKVYPSQDKAEAEAKREVEANWNEKEEGYYAKLAEEKAAKKNAKSWSVEFLGNSHYIETIADAESAQSKARRDLAIKERQLSQQGEEIRQEYWEFSQQIRKIEKEIESQKKK